MGKVLTVAELATYLGLAKDTIYRKSKAGEIPGVRIGRSWRFPQDLIDEWLRGRMEARDRGGKGGKPSRSRKSRFTTVQGGEIIRRLSRGEIYKDQLNRQATGGRGQEKREGKGRRLPLKELSRRRNLLQRILETRKAFEKLPISADEAYRISRRELERRPLRWN